MTGPRTDRELQPRCSDCAALCCVALPFSRSGDFAEAKPADSPCRHLLPDLRCSIHPVLAERGWRGCAVFECFGAGQRVTQETFGGRTWDDDTFLPSMSAVFRVVRPLHELLWYLTDPAVAASRHGGTASALRHEIDTAASLAAPVLARLDVAALRDRTALVLRAVSDDARGHARSAGRAAARLPRRVRPGADLAGARLAGADLRAAPLRGAFLVRADLSRADLRGADLLGTDLRDAQVEGADLRDAMFLTQPQVNAMQGSASTRLPSRLRAPGHWR